ncbi:MAG: 4Fe-4S dicluster domain-containing protein [Candidatus Omnitrophica bacterium]|nr:4Fe-4S dicluster domain-containing protein [Candidatus Omnitrophota bacterium]
MDQKYLKKDDFAKFTEYLAEEYALFYVKKSGEDKLHIARYEGKDELPVVGCVRPFEPLKNFFFLAREKVVDGYGKGEAIAAKRKKPFCILGVKNCDLAGLSILDYVFTEGDFQDPFYIKNRQNNLIIAADCTTALDTCFCHALGNRHYPEKNFDILISELGSGYIVGHGSDKGRAVIDKNRAIFTAVQSYHLKERDDLRRSVGDKVDSNIAREQIPDSSQYKDIIKSNLESAVWSREADKCVECGACNVVCPTCHCFYLFDSSKGDMKELRFKTWDSCMYERFARVAGGANPRDHLWTRLRNRFEKKFDYFPEVKGAYACTGCGRCISGCPAKIDIRKVLKELVAEKKTHQ